MPPLICHLDMNSYFASVEQQANPLWRGRPLGVCAYLHARGCIIAASVEAKASGMKVGMTLEEGRSLVPQAVFVQADPPKYRAVTGRIFSLLAELSDRVEHYSIDEAFLDLTGWYRDAAEAAFALSRIKQRIKQEVGEWLRCSVGLAPTRFLAKFASDRRKPDGLTVITPDNLEELLAASDLEDACGIGPRIRRRLEELGIMSLLELKHYPVGNLMHALGKNGYFLWCKVNGIECESVTNGEPLPKSIGHSYCVPARVNREHKVEATLIKLAERAGRRLRSVGFMASAMTVVVGRRGLPTLEEGRRLAEPIDDPLSIAQNTAQLLHRRWHGEDVNFLAVTLCDLRQPSAQTSFSWQTNHGRERGQQRQNLGRSLDRIWDRYGDEAIVLGRMWSTIGTNEAPDRIGFRKVAGNGE